MRQRDTNAIRLGMLAGLIRVATTFAGMWSESREPDVRLVLNTAVKCLKRAHDLLTAPPALIEVHHD